jgi:hypothetical protein
MFLFSISQEVYYRNFSQVIGCLGCHFLYVTGLSGSLIPLKLLSDNTFSDFRVVVESAIEGSILSLSVKKDLWLLSTTKKTGKL